jgi:hypothetical protein
MAQQGYQENLGRCQQCINEERCPGEMPKELGTERRSYNVSPRANAADMERC